MTRERETITIDWVTLGVTQEIDTHFAKSQQIVILVTVNLAHPQCSHCQPVGIHDTHTHKNNTKVIISHDLIGVALSKCRGEKRLPVFEYGQRENTNRIE